jgi:hypothetical protein
VFEGMFDTDVPGVQGFKRLMDVKTASEAYTPVLHQYLLVAFPDKASGNWKVAYFGSETDIESEIQKFRDYLDHPAKHPETRLVSKQEIYVSYAMWLLMNGRTSDSKNAILDAERADAQPTVKMSELSESYYQNNPQSNRDKMAAMKHTISRVSGIDIAQGFPH